MLNYIKSELYRSFQRPHSWIIPLIFIALSILGNTALDVDLINGSLLEAMFSGVVLTFSFISYLIPSIWDVTFSEEYKHGTLKNSVAFGFARTNIYLGKLISGMIYALLLCILAVLILTCTTFIIQGFDPKSTFAITKLVKNILCALPLWFATLSLCALLSFTFKNTMTFVTIFFLAMILPSVIISIMNLFFNIDIRYLYQYLIESKLSTLSFDRVLTKSDFLSFYSIGFIYFLAFTVTGIVMFNKKEIK